MRIEAHLNCFGYFGFGGGWLMANPERRRTALAMQDHYCNHCPLRQACWERHRDRVREMYPDLMAEIERLITEAGDDGNAGVKKYFELYNTAPPDLLVNAGNMEDGAAVGGGGKPKDRGDATLAYPFPTDWEGAS